MAKKTQITNIQNVFELFVSNVNMASVLKVGPSTVSEMKRRNSIPSEYWPDLVTAAAKIGRDDLTFEKLALISQQEAKRKSEAKKLARRASQVMA